MRSYHLKISVLLLVAGLIAGCATSQMSEQESGRSYAQSMGNELRVGVTPDYPPIIFRQKENITGVEADLARKLGNELNLPVSFLTLSWEEQIPALMNGKIDIIMSGMSITEARSIRIAFAQPYLKSGLIAAMRAEDVKTYNSKDSILNGYVAVGAVKDTTGDAFVKRNFPNAARKTFFTKASDGAFELTRRSIDIFINDAPSIIWLVSENEADLAGFWKPLTEEYLAWGFRKDDEKFLKDVNAILLRWKQNGTLNAVLQKWLPAEYLKSID